MSARCDFISPRASIRCQLDQGHDGKHRAWNEDGVPTLAMEGKPNGYQQ